MDPATIVCSICSDPVANNTKDVINCYGSCGKSFHISCLARENSSYSKSLHNYLAKIKNLHWYCDSCTTLPINGTAASQIQYETLIAGFQSTLQSQLDQINLFNTAVSAKNDVSAHDKQQIVTPPHQPQVDTSTGILTPNPSQSTENVIDIASQNTTSAADTAHTDNLPERDDINKSIITIMETEEITEPIPLSDRIVLKLKRRLSTSSRSEQQKSNPSKKKRSKWEVTNATTNADGKTPSKKNSKSPKALSEKVTVNPVGVRAPKSSLDEKREVYVTPFLPDTSVNHILSHLHSIKSLSSIMDKIECVKLVKKKMKMDKLTFVSFKIVVPKRYVTFLTHKSVWPSGLTVEHFNGKTPPTAKIDIKKFVAKLPKNSQQNQTQLKPKNDQPKPKGKRQRETKNGTTPTTPVMPMQPNNFSLPVAFNRMQMMPPWSPFHHLAPYPMY